jgi:hypothetical protein
MKRKEIHAFSCIRIYKRKLYFNICNLLTNCTSKRLHARLCIYTKCHGLLIIVPFFCILVGKFINRIFIIKTVRALGFAERIIVLQCHAYFCIVIVTLTSDYDRGRGGSLLEILLFRL